MADKHVTLNDNFGSHFSGESCSLPEDVANKLVAQKKATFTPVPEGKPRSAAIPAEPHADIPLVKEALAQQAGIFDDHVRELHEAHGAKVEALESRIDSLTSQLADAQKAKAPAPPADQKPAAATATAPATPPANAPKAP